MVTFWTSIDAPKATPVVGPATPGVPEVNQTDAGISLVRKGNGPTCEEVSPEV
jgi:hypothetical protein